MTGMLLQGMDGKYRDIFRKYQIFFIFSIYIAYFHFAALDWVMLIERLVFKLCISEWGY